MERQKGIDFIRVVSVFGIIVHHCCRELQSKKVTTPIWFGGNYANGNFGWYFVTLFLMISGVVMYLNYKEVKLEKLKNFYIKRIKSIYIPFITAWSFVIVLKAMSNGSLFYNGNPLCMILSILGLDEYLGAKFKVTYYFCNIGEWFILPIVFLYLIYPIIIKLFNKNKYILGAAIAIVFFLADHYTLTIQTSAFRGLASCLMSFYIGMLICSLRDKLVNNNYVAIATIAITTIMFTIPIKLSLNIQVHILGAVSLTALWWIGNIVSKIKLLDIVILKLSKLSYCIFLLQHIIISKITANYSGRGLSFKHYIFVIAVNALVIIFEAEILNIVSSYISNYKKNKTIEQSRSIKKQ